MYYVVDVTDLDNVDVMPVATGPYMVTGYVPEESYTLSINENYWGDKPSIENITVVNIAHDTKVSAVLAGSVDVAQGPTASTVSQAENNNVGVEIITASGIRETDLIVNCREGHPLSDSVLREALSYGLNREVLAMVSGGNYVEAIEGPFPAGANYGEVDGQSYDPEKAMALLAEGGYADPEYDALIAKLNETFDAEERMEIFVELQQHIIDDNVNLWLYAANEVAICSDRVEGVTLHPLNAYFITTDWTLVD